jgi:hypothetical protein
MKSDTVSVLKSGWGTFLLVAGVISLILDFAVPSVRLSSGESFPIFRGDSFTLGWFFIIGILIIPAALTRHFGAAPINAVMALIWCVAGFIAWVVLHSIIAGFDPSKPMRPNLALIGGLILCWRLLVIPKPEQPGVEIEPSPVSDEAAQETVCREGDCPTSPAKASLKQERQNTLAVVKKLSSERADFIQSAQFQVHTSGLGDKKKKIIGAGVLAILIVSMIAAHSERESPSIGWMLALSASWGLFVWLWPGWATLLASNWRKLIGIGAASLAAFIAIAIGAEASFSNWRSERAALIKQRDEAIAEDAEIINLANATLWYIAPADEIYAEVVMWRKWAAILEKEADYRQFTSSLHGAEAKAMAARIKSILDKHKSPETKELPFQESVDGFAKNTKQLTWRYRNYLDGLIK